MNERKPIPINPVVDKANQERFATVAGPRTGKEYEMREFTYGVLDPDPNNPLSCVSVANSSLSIDLWKGCAWKCSYCHVQGGLQDIDPQTLRMPTRPEKRSDFSVDEVIDALVEHPFFEDGKSVISIGTASTEPFARGPVSESTFAIMEKFIADGHTNPFWVVTKAGFPKEYEGRLKTITDNGNPVMISICWANNPSEVEPVQTNRFRNIDALKRAGATVSWYLRPLAEGWSTDPEHLRQTFKDASVNGQGIDMIIPGGLRWTEGIEYGVKELRDQIMPDIPKDDNVKDLSDETLGLIHELSDSYFPGIPVLHKSSCGLANMLQTPNHNLVQYQHPATCAASTCPDAQRITCASYSIPEKGVLQGRIARVGLNGITIESVDAKTGHVSTTPPINDMTFALRHMIEIQAARE